MAEKDLKLNAKQRKEARKGKEIVSDYDYLNMRFKTHNGQQYARTMNLLHKEA